MARRLVEQFARNEGFGGSCADLAIIVSELVANAFIHGGEPIELTLQAFDGELTVEVADGDARTDGIQPGTNTQVAAGGRGLRIVVLLADRWGTRSSQTGKTVWATVREHKRITAVQRPRRPLPS